MPIIYDLADPAELTGAARQVERDINQQELILSNFLPNIEHDEIAFRYEVGQIVSTPAATVRAWDTESPIAARAGIERKSGELVPISEKIDVGEELALRLRALREGTGNDALIAAIFDDADQRARAVARRIEMMRGELLETGKLVINENGVQATIDFGRDATHTGTSPATLWDDPAADIVADLQGFIEIYEDTNNGLRPAFMLVSTLIVSNLMRNESVRDLYRGANSGPGMVTREQLQTVLSAFDLPTLVPYNVTVDVAGTPTKVVSDDTIILLPPGDRRPGRTLVGPTREAVELVGARRLSIEEAAGIVVVNEVTYDPVITWTKAVTSAMGVLDNPNLTFAVEVI
jgi:hypothetical protein